MIPSLSREDTQESSISISGFKHIGGYPATYLIVNKKIIDYSIGAANTSITELNSIGKLETVVIATEEEVFEANYKLLRSKIEELLRLSRS